MNWQLFIVGLIILIASVYILRATWQTWARGKGGCGAKMGCGAKNHAKGAEQNGKAIELIPLNTMKLRQQDSESS